VHVPRREFERKIEIVLLVEKVRMKPKSSATESSNAPRTVEPSFIKFEAEFIVQWPFENSPCGPPGIGAKKVQESSMTRFRPTYIYGGVTLESASIDLNIGTARSTNSSALQVACGPPGIGAKI
jgi:hypothetical protein